MYLSVRRYIRREHSFGRHNFRHSLGPCDACGDLQSIKGYSRAHVEAPMVYTPSPDTITESPHFSGRYVKCEPLAKEASAAVREGHITITPKNFEADWFRFMEDDVRDWCISRQLWWGHRIPAYRVVIDGTVTEGREQTIAYDR